QKGFANLKIQKEKPIAIPADILEKYLSPEEAMAFNTGGTGIFSITVFAQKPGSKTKQAMASLSEVKAASDCDPKSGCC
ncbi:MAG: arsenite S-adenosylmethyltransferase, partial [Robiginitalea sp.]